MAVFDILMIDDDVDNYHSLKNYAFEFEVVLRHARTLQEGLEQLQLNDRILGIILDGKGLLYTSQTDAEATSAFVHQALTDIRILEGKRDKHYPKCVLTAWYDNLKDSLEPRGIRVFDKKKLANNDDQKKELFEYLIMQAKDSQEYSIRTKYKGVFEYLDEKYITSECENEFYNCCLALENGKPLPTNFNGIRNLYESVIVGIHIRDEKFLPQKLFGKGGRPNLEWTIRYLSGGEIKDKGIVIYESAKPRIPDHIHYCARFVKEISSSFSHTNNSNFTPFAYNAALCAWIEFFLWYKNWVDELSKH